MPPKRGGRAAAAGKRKTRQNTADPEDEYEGAPRGQMTEDGETQDEMAMAAEIEDSRRHEEEYVYSGEAQYATEEVAAQTEQQAAMHKAKAPLMKKNLANLANDSQGLYQHIMGVPASSEEAARDAWADLLDNYREDVNNTASRYPRQHGFIDAGVVLACVEPASVAERDAMDRILTDANLTTLLNFLWAADNDEDLRIEILQRIGAVFPTFFETGDQARAEPSKEVRDIAFEIRVQRLIEACRAKGSINPLNEFALIFYGIDTKDQHVSVLNGLMEKTPLSPMLGQVPSEARWAAEYMQEVNNLRLLINGEDREKITRDLIQAYSFGSLFAHLADWTTHQHGAISGEESQEPESMILGDSLPPESIVGDRAESLVQRQLREEAGETQGSTRSASESQPAWDPAVLGHVFGSSSGVAAGGDARSPSVDALQVLAHMTKVMGTQQAAGTPEKRRLPTHDNNNDGEDDDPFETDQRAPTKRTKRAPAKRSAPPPSSAEMLQQLALMGSTAVQSSAPQPTVPAASMGPPPPPSGQQIPSSSAPPQSSAIDLATLSQAANAVSKQYRREKPPKSRKGWTAHDVELLVRAVDTFDGRWSKIQDHVKSDPSDPQHIPMENPDRDQQAMRDKARLVKCELLKTDRLLPLSFDLVALGKKERQAIIDVHRNPDRKVADWTDVDIGNGNVERRPTNTVYIPQGAGA